MALPKAIFFDADDTLYESERLSFEAGRRAAHEISGFDLTWELFDKHVRRGTKKSHEVIAMHGFPVTEQEFQNRKIHHYDQLITEELKPMPGLLDFLLWCADQSIRCFVVSSNRGRAVAASLKILGIYDYFEAIVSHEIIGDQPKPYPFPYEHGLELAKVPASEALAVEDVERGIISAKTAGLFCVGIRSSLNDDSELTQADLIISNYSELKDFLLN